jgi:hypothetical protein
MFRRRARTRYFSSFLGLTRREGQRGEEDEEGGEEEREEKKEREEGDALIVSSTSRHKRNIIERAKEKNYS